MDRTFIKSSFVGFYHRVAPLQDVFHRECSDADLNTDVLEFLTVLQSELVEKMMNGACAVSQHQRSKDVAAEDLLLHLDTQWNLDPLIMSANCIKTSYQVTETTDTIDPSLSPKLLPRKKRKRCSSNLPKKDPASSKVKKNSARKYKPKSKCGQPNKTKNGESKVNSKSQDHSEHPLKNQLPLLNKDPDSSANFFGNKHVDLCNVDSVPKPSPIVPTYKPKSKVQEKISRCESLKEIKHFKGKAKHEIETPAWYHFDSKSRNKAGLKKDVSVADATFKLPSKVPSSKPKSNIEKANLTPESSIKDLPFEGKTESKCKVHFDPKALILTKTEHKDFAKQSLEISISKSKSKFKAMLSCEHSTKVFSLKEKTDLQSEQGSQASIELPYPNAQVLKIPWEKSKQEVPGFKYASVKTQTEVENYSVITPHPDSLDYKISTSKPSSNAPCCEPKSSVEKTNLTSESSIDLPFEEKNESKFKVHFDSETLLLSVTERNDFAQQSPELNLSKLKSNFKNVSTCEHSTKDFSLKEKTKLESEYAKKASIELPYPYLQVLKMLENKGKQKASGVKYASVKTLTGLKKHSVKTPNPDSHVCKTSRRRKQEIVDIDDDHTETPEEARKRFAMVLLRIAGRY